MNAALGDVLRYNTWATLTLFDACRGLNDEQLDARPPGVSGSVRELLVHVVGGQQTQVLRTKGRQHEGEFSRASAWRGFDVLIDLATTSSDELIAIAETLDGTEEVDLPFAGKVYRFPKYFFLTHAIEHGVEHRTEIKVALGALGVETPDLDGWSYSAAAGYARSHVSLTFQWLERLGYTHAKAPHHRAGLARDRRPRADDPLLRGGRRDAGSLAHGHRIPHLLAE